MSKFTDRASYLVYRAEWKANYKEISQKIRDHKQERSITNREFSKAELVEKYGSTAYYQSWIPLSNALSSLASVRAEANKLLEELKAAKVEAGKAYKAAKEIA